MPRRNTLPLTSLPALAALTLAVAFLLAPTASADTTVTINPTTPSGNNQPFGATTGLCTWLPYAAFVYKNVPAFELKSGDTVAFDMRIPNDVDIHTDIALAPTTTNGGDTNAAAFQKIVSTAQTPSNPRGNLTIGDFELKFKAEAPFSFAGGGLIIRFSNPSGTFTTDGMCDGVVVTGDATDASGYFVERSITDADGVAPWTVPYAFSILAFRLTIASLPTPQPAAKDTRAPVLTLGGAKTQHVLRQRSVNVTVTPDEASALTGTGSLALPKKTAKVLSLKPATKSAGAGVETKLKLKLSKKKLKAVRRALTHKRRLKTKVKVSATDAAGNVATSERDIKLVR